MKKYLFVDTCIISELIESKELRSKMNQLIDSQQYNCIIGDKTLSELEKSKSMLEGFYELSKDFKFDLAKSSNLIIKEEISCYKKGLGFDLTLIGLSGAADSLESFINLFVQLCDKEFPEGAKNEILESILKLRDNYPPRSGRKYLNRDIVLFYRTIVKQQLLDYNGFDISTIKSSDFELGHFKSLISKSLIVFWKFYKMRDRKSRESDVFDISMSSCFPYITAILTENNLANDIRMIKKERLFFKNLENIMTLKDLKAFVN